MTTPSAPARCCAWCDEHAAMTEPEERKTSGFLSTSIVIAALLIFASVFVYTFSPMLWTDHAILPPTGTGTSTRYNIPTGCQVLSTSAGFNHLHCPIWVQYP